MLTFTSAAVADHPVNAPTDDYLRTWPSGYARRMAGQPVRSAAIWPSSLGRPVPGLQRRSRSSPLDSSAYLRNERVSRGYERRDSLNIGKTREVFVSYAANPGRNSTSRRQSSLRSSPVTSVASTGKVAVPTSTIIRGCCLRL